VASCQSTSSYQAFYERASQAVPEADLRDSNFSEVALVYAEEQAPACNAAYIMLTLALSNEHISLRILAKPIRLADVDAKFQFADGEEEEGRGSQQIAPHGTICSRIRWPEPECKFETHASRARATSFGV
jgi:hypothetical protein